MIATQDQTFLAHWLCDRIGLVATPNLKCIGQVKNSKLVAVIGYDSYNGASIQMHSAGEGNWNSRELLRTAFHYPFEVCKVNMVIGMVPSGNARAIRFNTHLGFKTIHVLEGAHPDGALVLMTMKRGECRFLYSLRRSNGQKILTAATA